MGKINKRNIKTKAKNAVTRAAAEINKLKDRKTKRDEGKLLLHKTITPKKVSSKKEKFHQKHKQLLDKFAIAKKLRKEENSRKNREQTAVIGDLKPLKDALPSLDELFKLSKESKDIKTGVKEFDAEQPQKMNAKEKLRSKKKKFITKVNSYQALLKDPDFKKNPRDVIAYHIKYTHGLIDE